MNSDPLYEQFEKVDQDHDDKITISQTVELMNLQGIKIYPPSVFKIIQYLNPSQEKPACLTYEQFTEYYQSYVNRATHYFWKKKISIQRDIFLIQRQMQADKTAPEDEINEADSCEGNLKMLIGSQNGEYNSSIGVKIMKNSQQYEQKPFIKISLEQSNPDSAANLQKQINKFQLGFRKLIEQEQPETAVFLQSFKIFTQTQSNQILILVTTTHQTLIELSTILSKYFDNIFTIHPNIQFSFSHQFNISIPKFMDLNSQYSIYDAFIKNSCTHISWKGHNFRQKLQHMLKKTQIFNDLKHNNCDPFSWLLILLLQTSLCQGSFTFDNVEFDNVEMQSKEEILQFLKEIFNIIEFMEDNKIQVKKIISLWNQKMGFQISVGEWVMKANLLIKSIKNLFLNKQ